MRAVRPQDLGEAWAVAGIRRASAVRIRIVRMPSDGKPWFACPQSGCDPEVCALARSPAHAGADRPGGRVAGAGDAQPRRLLQAAPALLAGAARSPRRPLPVAGGLA